MAILDAALTLLGPGGFAAGVTAIVKTVVDRSEVSKKLVVLETVTIPAFERRVSDALLKFPALESRAAESISRLIDLDRRVSEAVAKIDAQRRAEARASRSNTDAPAQLGAAMAEMAALRREVEALKGAVDALKQVSPVTVQRVSALEDRFGAFETTYHEDYGELAQKVAGFAGEFKQAMRRGGNGNARPSTDSG
jgi:chromosome segregation ATPase